MQHEFRRGCPRFSKLYERRLGLDQNCLRAGLLLTAVIALLTLFPQPVLRAATPVLIGIDTQAATPLPLGFSGVNMPQPRTGVEYFDPKYVAAATPLKPGWIRYPGGTVSLAFDWEAGHINTDWMNSLIAVSPPLVAQQTADILTVAQQLTQAKGGNGFADFATFSHTLGASAILCFNSYTDNKPASAALMALAAQTNGLNVLEWELGNEAYFYPRIYSDAASYAAASNSYFTGIRVGAPHALVGLFLGGLYSGVPGSYATWDTGLSAVTPPGYTPHYWSAVSNHVYPIVSTVSTQDTIWLLNGILAHGSADYVNSYLLPLAGPGSPIYVSELNCCSEQTNPFLTYLYNGIFLAEYISRLAAVPNVKGVGINSLYTDNNDYHGLIQSVNDYETYLLGQVAADPSYATNTALNPDTQFQFFTSAPGVAMEIANQVINSSEHLWPTTVTGGPVVGIAGFDGQPIPAIYAQAYRGHSGKPSLLITNKSAFSEDVVIQVNGVQITDTLSLTWVSNTSPAASNTAQAPTHVQIQTGTSSNPTRVGPYSVTSITW